MRTTTILMTVHNSDDCPPQWRLSTTVKTVHHSNDCQPHWGLSTTVGTVNHTNDCPPQWGLSKLDCPPHWELTAKLRTVHHGSGCQAHWGLPTTVRTSQYPPRIEPLTIVGSVNHSYNCPQREGCPSHHVRLSTTVWTVDQCQDCPQTVTTVNQRDTRFCLLFVQGRFLGNAEQTNAVSLSNIWCLVIGWSQSPASFGLAPHCLYIYSLSK